MKPRNIYVTKGDRLLVRSKEPDRGTWDLVLFTVDGDEWPSLTVNLRLAKSLGYKIHVVE